MFFQPKPVEKERGGVMDILNCTKEYAQSVIWDENEDYSVVSDNVIGSGYDRTNKVRKIVKEEKTGKYYAIDYLETSDGEAYDFEDREVYEVEPKEKTVVEYVKKEASDD